MTYFDPAARSIESLTNMAILLEGTQQNKKCENFTQQAFFWFDWEASF